MHTYIAFLKGVLCIEEEKIPLVETILILPYPKVMRGEGCQYASCMSLIIYRNWFLRIVISDE